MVYEGTQSMPSTRHYSGSSGASVRRKRLRELRIALSLGLVCSAVVGLLIYLLYLQSRG
jgi:Mg/Co/Ni transporter MgtE